VKFSSDQRLLVCSAHMWGRCESCCSWPCCVA